MGDWILEMAFAVIFGALRQVVKNPARKEELRRVLLKLCRVIHQIYGDDPDFKLIAQ